MEGWGNKCNIPNVGEKGRVAQTLNVPVTLEIQMWESVVRVRISKCVCFLRENSTLTMQWTHMVSYVQRVSDMQKPACGLRYEW